MRPASGLFAIISEVQCVPGPLRHRSAETLTSLVQSNYHHDVRTTITLDDDVAAKLEAERRRSGRSLRETMNHFLRLGLTARQPKRKKPFVIRDVGFNLGFQFDSAAELIERLEGPFHK